MAGARQLATVTGHDRAQELSERAGPVLRGVEPAVRAQGLDEALAAALRASSGAVCLHRTALHIFSWAIRSLVGVHRHAVHSVRSPALLITVRQRLIHNATCSHRTKSGVMQD